MLSTLKRRLRRNTSNDDDAPAHPVNYTKEHVRLAKTITRRKKLTGLFWTHLPYIRFALALIGILWLLALPYEGLWKGTYIDEHAIQPAQVSLSYDWANVHKADLYLDQLELLVNASRADRSEYLQSAFSTAGLWTGNTSSSTFAHVAPPRSSGTEVILLSANWVSREGSPNLRGVAMLLSLGDFLRGTS